MDSLSESLWKKVKLRFSASNSWLTLSCNKGYIDHDLSTSFAFGLGFRRGFGSCFGVDSLSLCTFGFGSVMLNGSVCLYCASS
jgi:hypothetical protein